MLWFLLGLFCLRVLGQVLVAFWGVRFLPPMEEWYSGLIPYPILLPIQIGIIILMARVCYDFSRGRGFFVEPRRGFGRGVLTFGYVYLAAMILRYVIRMGLYPEERWWGGTIPIFFHWVLAAFVILFGRFHRFQSKVSTKKADPSLRSG
jgi:hypothetical protein